MVPARSLNTAGPGCGEGESISIVSDSLPDTEGCYLESAEFINGNRVYTASGTMDVGQMWIVAAEYTDEDEAVTVSGIYTSDGCKQL